MLRYLAKAETLDSRMDKKFNYLILKSFLKFKLLNDRENQIDDL